MKLVWHRKAVCRLEDVRQYLDARNPRAAVEVATRLMDAVAHVTTFPDMAPEGREAGTRELVVGDMPYVFVYRIEPHRDRIVILTLFHTSQDR